MAARRRGGGGKLIGLYQQYKSDSLGWGVPAFGVFRARLCPLRAKRDKADWPEEDMVLVMTLQEEGAGYALQRLFGGPSEGMNPVAKEILGETAIAREMMSPQDLENHLGGLIKSCRTAQWTAGEYMTFIDYLDGKTKVDGVDSDGDKFAEMYRQAGAGYKRRVREIIGQAADRERQQTVGAAAQPADDE